MAGDRGDAYVLSLEDTPIPTWIHDRGARRVVAANDAAVDALGWPRDELLAARCDDEAEAQMNAAARGRTIGKWRRRTKDGRVVEIDGAVTPCAWKGREAWLVQALRVGPVARCSWEMLERIEAVLEHAEEGLSLTGPDGVVEYVSPAVEKILGIRPDEIVGRQGTNYTRPEDLEGDAMQTEAARVWREPGARQVFVSRSPSRERGDRWIEANLTNLLHEPSIRAMVAHFRDVTDRVEARAALEATKARLEYLLSATSSIIYTARPTPPPAVTFMSENVAKVLGYTPQQFIDDPSFWADRLHPDERAAILAEMPRVFEVGRHVHEYRFRHADGSYRWMHDELVIARDEHGTPREVIGCFFDVTARREAEEARRRSEASFRALIERAPIAVIVHRDEQVLYANDATVALLGYERADDLVGRSPFALVAPDFVPGARQRTHVLETTPGDPITPLVEGEMLRRDGTRVAVEVEGMKLDFGGTPACVVLARDLSERRSMLARLAAADRLASMGTLAAGVAHEINNPLAFVQTNIALLLEELPRLLRGQSQLTLADAEQLLIDAREGGARMGAIVRDLRALAHPDQESVGDVDVREVLETCLRMAQNDIRQRARLTTRIASVPPVHGNATRLGQVFLNLVVNAAQAIPQGRVDENEIRVSLYAAASGDVVVEVGDTGGGIRGEILAHIFDPFFTTKPLGVGTGLGLAICHGIVKSMNGEIGVDSDPPRGTTFRVVLPASRGGAGAASSPKAAKPGGDAMRVLIVDDERSLCRALEIMLRNVHHVEFVTRAADALERLESGARYDVILCDLMMAEMNGMQLYEALSARWPELAPRVVFLTGGAFTPASREFLERVPNLRLEKPFEMRQLYDAIATVRATASGR